MPDSDPQLQYWDYCMFISFLTKHPDRLEIVTKLLERERKGFIKVVVSTLVTAEVRPTDSIKDVGQKQIEIVQELFESGRLDFRAVTPKIGEDAQKLGMKHRQLSPADCVHIETAIAAGVAVLFTFDGIGAKPPRRNPAKMLTYDGQLGNPPLAIKAPFVDEGPLFQDKQAAT